MRARGLAAALALVIACASGHVCAQSAASVDLVVTPAAARGLDVERVREGLAQELHSEVRVVPRARRPRAGVATLTVRSRGAQLELERVREDGSRMVRRTELPEHPDERAATVVILAANMLRDEASELLALLRRRDPSSSPTPPVPEPVPDTGATDTETPPVPEPVPEPVPDATVTETATPPVPEPVPDTGATDTETPPVPEPVPEPVPDAAVTETVTETETETVSDTEIAAATDVEVPTVVVRSSSATSEASSTAPPTPEPSAPGPAFFRIGLDAQVGSVPRGAGYEATLIAGLELAFMPIPELAIGLRDIGAGVLPNTNRTHVGGALFVELAWSLFPEIALYGQLGAHVQSRIFAANDPSTGVAPLLVGGVRFQLAREFSIGVESAVRVVATDSFVTYFHAVPQGAVLWTGGLTLLFHVN